MIVYFVKKNGVIVYIGQTVTSLASRKGCAIYQAKKGRGSVLGAAIRKHGADKFEWVKVREFKTQVECCKYERKMIAEHKPQYNQQCGGKTGFNTWNKGRKEHRPEVIYRISHAAKNRKPYTKGPCSKDGVENIRKAKLKNVAKPFICHQNGKTYFNKIEAADDLKIPAVGISLVLMPTTRNKSYKGYTFEYLAQDKLTLIDLESQRWETGRKAKAAVND